MLQMALACLLWRPHLSPLMPLTCTPSSLPETPNPNPGQVLYMAVVVALLDYSHDTWFYLTHRLLHWGPLYRHVHYIHHK